MWLEKIFKKWIEGYLKDKNVVLVTHQIQHLKEVQNIVIVDKFEVKIKGNYSELKENGLDFEGILNSYMNNNKNNRNNLIDIEDWKEGDIFGNKMIFIWLFFKIYLYYFN